MVPCVNLYKLLLVSFFFLFIVYIFSKLLPVFTVYVSCKLVIVFIVYIIRNY